MTAKLYGPLNSYVGSITLPEARTFPRLIWLDESPRGGRRLFIYRGESDYYDEVTNEIPVVRLDATNELTP